VQGRRGRAGYDWTPSFEFVIPAKRGIATGFKPTTVDVYLCAGARLGDEQASDTLAASLETRGWHRMAEVIREYRGKRFCGKGRVKDLKAFYLSLKADSYSTDEQRAPGPEVKGEYGESEFPSLADQGQSSGLWLANVVTGDLERPLSMYDVFIEGARLTGRVVLDGTLYEVVDGATYHTKVRSTPRLIQCAMSEREVA